MSSYLLAFALPLVLVVLLPARWAVRAATGLGFVLASALAIGALVSDPAPEWEGGSLGLVALAALLFGCWMVGVGLGVGVRAAVAHFRR